MWQGNIPIQMQDLCKKIKIVQKEIGVFKEYQKSKIKDNARNEIEFRI